MPVGYKMRESPVPQGLARNGAKTLRKAGRRHGGSCLTKMSRKPTIFRQTPDGKVPPDKLASTT